jgi:hypothetical protein
MPYPPAPEFHSAVLYRNLQFGKYILVSNLSNNNLIKALKFTYFLLKENRKQNILLTSASTNNYSNQQKNKTTIMVVVFWVVMPCGFVCIT